MRIPLNGLVEKTRRRIGGLIAGQVMQGKRTTHFPLSMEETVLTDLFVTAIKRLSIRSKQILMLDLYADENFFLERFVDFLVNPIVGSQGIKFNAAEDAPKTEETLLRFLELNELHEPQKQRELVRDGVLTGELCLIREFNEKKQVPQLYQVFAPSIRGTIVDPGNYTKIAAVEMEQENGETVFLRVIDDDDKFTARGIELRRACAFDCFLLQHKKRTHPTLNAYAGQDPLRKYEIRGEPWMMNSADLLQALVKYFWTSLDKTEAMNRYNMVFTVDVNGATEEEIEKKVRVWRDALKTPKPNTAIYLPPHIKMLPVTYPMQSQDLSTLYKMFRNAAAWHAGTRETSMGEGEVRYASNENMGVAEPTLEVKEILQADYVSFFSRVVDSACCDAVSRKEIPVKELARKAPQRYKYKVVSNEISKRSQESLATAARNISEMAATLREGGFTTLESLNEAVALKIGELLGVKLEPGVGIPVLASGEEQKKNGVGDGDEGQVSDKEKLMEMLLKGLLLSAGKAEGLESRA